jgi:uncharacterized protein with HEPN domain
LTIKRAIERELEIIGEAVRRILKENLVLIYKIPVKLLIYGIS